MRFMILRKADQQTEAGALPDEQMLTVMGNYMQEISDAGVLLGGEGLKPTSEGARVKFTKGTARVIDGPFAESKEVVAGFYLIEAEDMEEAIEIASQLPSAAFATIEVRPCRQLEVIGQEPRWG